MSQADFGRTLELVAKLANFQLTADVAEFYRRSLKPYDTKLACEALLRVAENVTPRTGMPSVAQIRAAMGVRAANHDEVAREISEAIATALARFGSINASRAEEFLGPHGWEVVRKLGGWIRLCETAMVDELPVLKAQWREIAKGVVATGNLGTEWRASLAEPAALQTRQTIQAALAASPKITMNKARGDG